MEKKGNLITDEPIVWVIGICVFLLIAFLLFKADIYSIIRNLPVPHADKIDEEVDYSSDKYQDEMSEGEVCPADKIVGSLKRYSDGKWYIYFGDEKSDFVWNVDEEDGSVLFNGKIVAEVKDGKVILDEDYLDFDSDKFQEIRFEDVSVDDFVNLYKSFYYGSNLICDGKTEDVGVGSWGSLLDYNLIELKVEHDEETGNNKVTFPEDYLIIPEGSRFSSLYLIKQEDYFEIRGEAANWFDYSELGRIYSDGSIWFDVEKIASDGLLWFKKKSGVELGKDFDYVWRGMYKPYYESNIKITKENFIGFYNSLK